MEPAAAVARASDLERSRSKILQWALAFTILAALVWLAVRTIDFRQVAYALSVSDWRLVAFAGVLAVTVCMLACSFRLWLLTLPLPTTAERPVSFGELTSIYYASSAAHHLLPAPAAEVLRTVHLKRRHGYSIGSLVACQLVEKVIDALSLGVETLVVALVAKLPPAIDASLYVFAAVAGGGVVATLVIARRHRRKPHVAEIAGVRGFLHRLSEGLYLLRSPRVWTWSIVCSFLNDGANAATVGLCLYAVGAPLPVSSWFVIVLVARLAGLLPSTPGQFGVIEASMAVAMVGLGVDRNLALAAAVLYHLAHFVPVTLAGLWELRRHVKEAS